MIFGKTKLELKVGVFVFIGLTILTVFVLSIGGFKTWTSGYRVHFIFHFVNGVKVGAPVRVAGVDVGMVKEIRFIPPSQDSKTKVDIISWVKKDTQIPIDSRIWVNTLGLLGEKYVEVMPGKDYSKVLTDDQDLVGEDPMPMQEVTDLAVKIADDIDTLLVKIRNKEGTLGKLIYEDTIYNELETFVKDIRQHPWKLLIKTK
jgi:phospholipid/cholesterol/gamma-HCH transport system substrate-binding protein